MEKSALNNLLAKIDNFVNLVSFADAELEEIFKNGLSFFLGKDISDEDFQAWVQKNSNYLEGKLGLQWMVGGSFNERFLETPFGNSNTNEYIYLRLYQRLPVSKDDFKIKESAMLQSSGTIPTLYYYKVIPFFFSGLEKIDKKYSSYLFLAEAIQNLFGLTIDDVFMNNFSKLVNNNSRLRSILEVADTVPTILGSGQEGIAFSIGPTRVLKIFKQKASLQHAINSIRRLHTSPELARTEAMIYDAGSIGNFGTIPIYYYIIEKMKTVLNMEKNDQNTIHEIVKLIKNSVKLNQEYWDSIKEILMDQREHSNIKNIINDAAKNLANHLRATSGLDFDGLTHKHKLKSWWLESLCEEIIIKLLTNRDDLHVGNLGVTFQGEFRYFDPSFDFGEKGPPSQYGSDVPTIAPPPMSQ